MYSRLVQTAYKVTVTDVLTGYFAWTREVIESLRPHLKSEGFAIEMEMVTKMARMGYKIFSVPISYDPRLGDSSLNPIRDGSRILRVYFNNLRWKPTAVSKLDIITKRRRFVNIIAPLDLLTGKLSQRHAEEENSSSI